VTLPHDRIDILVNNARHQFPQAARRQRASIFSTWMRPSWIASTVLAISSSLRAAFSVGRIRGQWRISSLFVPLRCATMC
jgi:hypothetical protein